MALIGEIQKKSGIVLIVVAASLVLFIVGDIFRSNSTLFGGDPQKVGEIAGQDISIQDFENQSKTIRSNYEAQYGRSATEEEMVSIREQTWNQFVLKLAYQKQYDALGLEVTDDELADMVQGNNISPAVKQIPIFTNKETGLFDKNLVVQYLKSLSSAPAQNRAIWANFEQELRLDRLRSKYENLITLSSYVTTEEAKKEYEAQTAKASAKILYVPFYSIPDSTIKVADSQLEAYLNKNKSKYKGVDTRNIQYVTFSVLPTKDDSANFYQEIKDLAKGLASAANDSSFAKNNSDVPVDNNYVGIADMSEPLRQTVSTFNVGGIYGPYQEGDTYVIYKLKDSKRDSVYSSRASHILIRSDSKQSDSAKAVARKKAEGILAQIKGGADFAEMARANGTDGSANNGGDLGWFTPDKMVKPFSDAVFKMNGPGLVPYLVETDFGYHIVKVTEPKTNLKYKLLTIKKTIAPSQSTQDAALRRAEAFAAETTNLDEFKANLKKDPTLAPFTAEKLRKEATNLNDLTNAREIIRWAFNEDTEVNSVSKVFDVDNRHVVAVLTGKTDEESVKVDDYRVELTAKVRNELKAEQIIAKLGAVTSLEDAAKKYGSQAIIETANDVTLANPSLSNIGFDPVAVGKMFGLKKGTRTKPFAGESGVLVVEVSNSTPAPAIADYGSYKTQLKQSYTSRATYYINETIKENAEIKDNRSKFY